jgi:DNA-binding transcriptional ArsR family regulator
MRPDPDISAVAALLGDRSRALMVEALADGRALSAGELARRARVTAQTASTHLARLVDGGLVRVARVGRRREFQLASAAVGELLEALSVVAGAPPPHEAPPPSRARAVRQARTCYDHLAGALGVAVTTALVRRGYLQRPARALAPTDAGVRWLCRYDVDPEALAVGRRPLTRVCLDWSERRPHLGGALGAALTARFFALGWIVQVRDSRAVLLTPPGRRALTLELGLDVSG